MPKTEEEWDAAYTRLGRPDKSDEYNIVVGDGYPDEMKAQLIETVPFLKDAFHKVGLNHKQATGLYSAYTGILEAQVKAKVDVIKQEMEDATNELKTEYGDGYSAKIQLANRAIDEFGGEELIELFKTTGLGRNPIVVKAFVKMGETIAEDLGLDKLGEPLQTPGEIQDEIDQLQARPEYMDETSPAHKSTVNRVQALMKRLYPESPAA